MVDGHFWIVCPRIIGIHCPVWNPRLESDIHYSLEEFKTQSKEWSDSNSNSSVKEDLQKIASIPFWQCIHTQMTEAKKNDRWFYDDWHWGWCDNIQSEKPIVSITDEDMCRLFVGDHYY